MKRVAKPVFFIIFLLILLFSYTAIFGISTQYGDIKTTWINGKKAAIYLAQREET